MKLLVTINDNLFVWDMGNDTYEELSQATPREEEDFFKGVGDGSIIKS